MPSQTINYWLTEPKFDLGDVAHVAVNRSSRANLFGKLRYVAFKRPSLRLCGLASQRFSNIGNDARLLGPSFSNAELAALLTDHHAAIRAEG